MKRTSDLFLRPRCNDLSRIAQGLSPGRRRLGSLAAVLFAMGALFSAPRSAAADDADTLLKDGKSLMKEGKLAEACPKLEESQRLSPRAATLLEVAACSEKQGKIATAWSQYIDVEAEARKDGSSKLEADAKARSRKLEPKLPRLTVSVPTAVASAEGFELKLDGAVLDKSDWNKSRPLDPGEHKLTATASGRKPWEQTVTVRIAEKKGIAVPALAADGAAKPGAGAGVGTGSAPTATGKVELTPTKDAAPSAPTKPDEPGVAAHRPSRLVGEVSLAAGFLFGTMNRGSFSGLSEYDYLYPRKAGEYVEICGADKCDAAFSPAAGVFFGGQGFFGYAMSEDLHIGARALGGYRLGGDFLIIGGPSATMRVSESLWLGLTLMVGGAQHTATIEGIKGTVPAEYVQFNQGAEEVDVPLKSNTPEEGSVGTLAFGGTVEVSYVLVDLPRAGWTSGALMVSAWPTFMKGLDGIVLAVPVGLGYRFY